MNDKNKKDKNLEDIDLEKLEELIIRYTQEVIDCHEYEKILKDNKEEEITKTYKLK